MKQQINNLKYLKNYRKTLRHNLTPAEATLWKFLQGSKLDGKKFRRQHSVGNYILDFYCPSQKLAIELDGAHHFTAEGEAKDTERTKFLNEYGIKVIRFENKIMFDDLDAVLEEIRAGFKLV